jgi:lipase chaperone LimK
MQRSSSGVAGKLDVGAKAEQGSRRLRLVSSALVGREKYRVLDLKRRRAQIRARRELGLI